MNTLTEVKDETQTLAPVRCSAARVAHPERVPETVAVCPECGGALWWQVTTDDGLADMVVDCEREDDDNQETWHRWWQGEWQPVIDKIKAWLLKPQNC